MHVKKLTLLSPQNLPTIPQLQKLPASLRREIGLVAKVLPFRTNSYVLNELIDWDAVPDDPLFQVTFPRKEMIAPTDYDRLATAADHAEPAEIAAVISDIRERLNPHPAAQQTLNVPSLEGRPVEGIQHKYAQTVLVFPRQGQTCHSYCTYCFRWAQFVGDPKHRFATTEPDRVFDYLRRHREVTDVLFTGGDPLVLSTRRLEEYVRPLLDAEFDHIQTIRLGTKALAYWPRRFVTDKDADDLLRLFELLAARGKHVALVAHFNHWRELEPPLAASALRRIRNAGVTVHSQGPILRHVNDSADVWARLWKTQVRLGIIPYYCFVARNTGAHRHFQVPLARALGIYEEASARVSGLGRTARGPVMSAGPGKVLLQGTVELDGARAFSLRFLQARIRRWFGPNFLAEFDPDAAWLSDLRPFRAERFFFEDEYEKIFETRYDEAEDAE